ncbi:MAG: SDR family NAD(P)-dependent oxidoreductase [Alphaproteobacteria bacterium]
MGLLDNRVALVTASGGAIAGAIARRFGAAGAAVYCLDINDETVAQTASDIRDAGGVAQARGCDVTDEAAVKAAIAHCVETLGGLDIVVNAAAGFDPKGDILDLPVEIWRSALDVNVTGMFIVCKYAVPHMLAAGGGKIVNISSIYGNTVGRGRPVYNASKAAVRLLTKSIAVDFATRNIRANSIMPGPIETPRLLQSNPSMDAVRARHKPHLPMERLGRPEEIAETALFLCSDLSSFTTGADLFVDGGYSAF